jgi:hypothetical protein
MSIDAAVLPLGKVATVQGGFPFRGSVEALPHGSVLAVQMKDLTVEDGIDWAGVARTELPGRRSADWLATGDILFVCRGTRFYASCIDEPPHRAVCTPHFFHLRIQHEASVLPAFLAWLINQGPVQRQLLQAAEGSNQLSIRRPVLEAVTVRIPSFANQYRIVSLAQLARKERQTLQKLIHNRERELEGLAEELSADQ